MLIAYIIVDKIGVARENAYYSSLALEWTVPNVQWDFTVKDRELTPFARKNFPIIW